MVGDNTDLPFEVRYSEMPSSKSRTMKRLAILLKPENVDWIVTALRAGGLEATIYDVKGASKEKERVASGRGSGMGELAYTNRKVVATVVNSDDVSSVVDKMKNALGGESGAVVMIRP